MLLTWFSVGAVNARAEHFDRALGEMDHFAMLEASLHRDVQSARARVLRNDDPLAREANALGVSSGRLRQAISRRRAKLTALAIAGRR
jgi:hypothetical protein